MVAPECLFCRVDRTVQRDIVTWWIHFKVRGKGFFKALRVRMLVNSRKIGIKRNFSDYATNKDERRDGNKSEASTKTGKIRSENMFSFTQTAKFPVDIFLL